LIDIGVVLYVGFNFLSENALIGSRVSLPRFV
jgi:hypothetical protein